LHLFYQPEISEGHLLAEESRHAVKVLRLQAGDEIELVDGKGQWAKVRITFPESRKCAYEIMESALQPRRDFSIHLGIAPTKNADRTEWMVEKCVEIGVEKISFLVCKTSERKIVHMDRLEKIAISAMKQSRQAWLPLLMPMTPFGDFTHQSSETQKFIAYVDEKNPVQLKHLASPGSDYVVLIGPEGDFTGEELASAQHAGFLKVSLGPNRLRTETAGLAAVLALNLINQK
jgi:16S rRNA (uracil1498-N3)-methyltransferase